MKKRTKILLIVILFFSLATIEYMRYYPIKHDNRAVQKISQNELGIFPEHVHGIGYDNGDFYYLVADLFSSDKEEIAVIKLEEGALGRFRYKGISRTDANFVNGVVNSNGKKYMLVGGLNPNHEIDKIAFTLDHIPYEIVLNNPGQTFLESIEIDNNTTEEHIFLDNTVLYNAAGEDITAKIDTSSGGI